MNTIKKRLAKTKQTPDLNEIANKYNHHQDIQESDQDENTEEEDFEDDSSDLSEQDSTTDGFSTSVVLEEIIVKNMGDVDGDGKNDYLLEENIVIANTQTNQEIQDTETQSDIEEAQEPSPEEESFEPTEEDVSFQQEKVSPHHAYQKMDDSQEVETPKNISAALNIGMGHSRDDIVRDKFEKHIQKIRYDANILKQRNDILGYEKKLVEGLTVLPNDIDLEKQLADLYFHQGKYKKAQSLLKKIIAENAEDHNALRQMGEIATEDKQGNDDAFAYLQQAYTLCDDNPKYAYSLAQRYYDHEDLQAALPLLEKITRLRPKNIDYLVSLSHMQHKIGDREGAKNSILRALELDPMNMTLKHYLKSLQ